MITLQKMVNGWKGLSWSSQVGVMGLLLDLRSEPHFRLSSNRADALCDSGG